MKVRQILKPYIAKNPNLVFSKIFYFWWNVSSFFHSSLLGTVYYEKIIKGTYFQSTAKYY